MSTSLVGKWGFAKETTTIEPLSSLKHLQNQDFFFGANFFFYLLLTLMLIVFILFFVLIFFVDFVLCVRAFCSRIFWNNAIVWYIARLEEPSAWKTHSIYYKRHHYNVMYRSSRQLSFRKYLPVLNLHDLLWLVTETRLWSSIKW